MKTKSEPARFFVCKKDDKGNVVPPVVQVTRSFYKKIVAAQLRTQAARLVLLAEQLEATAPKQPRRKKQPAISLVEMVKQAGKPARGSR